MDAPQYTREQQRAAVLQRLIEARATVAMLETWLEMDAKRRALDIRALGKAGKP